jgi:DNA-binding response OmpR family regulator
MSKTVALIEDNLDLRMAFKHVLSHAGYEVYTSGDGEQGLALIRENPPDIILLDMLLPKRSGLDVLRALKSDAATANIPVLVLSSLPQSNASKLRLEGAAGYLVKSELTDSNALVWTVERTLASVQR